ncbi:hypothetical protein ANN_14607 [Periplaneta americana]|uniref:Uncharacterized protein n=1 Tax=Periplaneta americana TaxID=6978 RepID=A0ABQ8SYW7_PERAM|nr:hypothetical protein ANN_14607 [Periplaneta americana]
MGHSPVIYPQYAEPESREVKCSANDKSALYRYKTSANDKSALYRYKTPSIDYSRICNRKRISEKSRRLKIQYSRRRSLYKRPPEATGSLDRPPWNVTTRRWMASAMNTRGGPTRGRSFASDRRPWGKLPKQEWCMASSAVGTASSIRQNASYEVYEEVGCVSSDGSTRRADIIIIDRQKDKGVILDPTISFEIYEQQPQEKWQAEGGDSRSCVGIVQVVNDLGRIEWLRVGGRERGDCFIKPAEGVCILEFPGKWIGRGGSVPWPPRSPDLTLFVWEQMRNLVYATPVESEDDLVARIFAAAADVTFVYGSMEPRDLRSAVMSMLLLIEAGLSVKSAIYSIMWEHCNRKPRD